MHPLPKPNARRAPGAGKIAGVKLEHPLLNQVHNARLRLHARLHPIWTGGRDGYRYSVLFDGQLLVQQSRDPETDAARALVAKGITGKLTMLNGKNGKPRTVINIEKAAKLVTTEENRSGLRFRKPPRDTDNSPSSLETGAVEAVVVAESNWGAR